MQRLVQSLPQIPNVIKGQMEGKPDELKKMVSSMLGDGLLSQLVVNPLGVAENMGVPLHDLGINKTVLDETIKLGGGNNETSGAAFNFLSAFYTSTQAPTTKSKKMYIDGVEVKDWDNYARKYHLENLGYTTIAPLTSTVQLSPEKIADVVLQKLKEREPVHEAPRSNPDISNSLDMNLIDPRRVAEVNSLLRRAPQRFESPQPASPMDIGPPGFVQSLDPAIDEVVTNLRTKGAYGLNVDDVKRLQNILQTYEQTLQTKELLSRRKQLEVLQTELTEQRKRIEVQKKMEEELRKKERELEEAKQKMEQKLREQLSSWHSSFGPTQPKAPVALPDELQLESLGSPPSPRAEPIPSTTLEPPAFQVASHERKLAEEREEIVEQQMLPVPPPTKISSTLRNHIRYSPTPVVTEATPEVIPPSTSVDREDDEFVSKCNCEKISLDKMNGKWLMALASPNVVEMVQGKAKELLDKTETLSCSRFDVNAGKQSVAAQDARLIWQFRTQGAPKLFRLRGSALTMDHESVRVQMTDFQGDNFSFPFCVLKSGGTSTSYEHLLVTNSQGDCKDVALLVRDPQEFFDNPNKQLQKYLKTKIAKKEMNTLDVVNFGDC
uniref:FH2 domain-containing protein n=1 Tax=Caenorhabditis tropicalis TaxID=1561998 RepID=A0A1I7V3I9_9PELO